MAQHTRTETLLAQLAGGSREPEALTGILAPGRVAVLVAADAAREQQGQLLVSFAVNLLARLYPVVQDLHIVIHSDAALTVAVPRWRSATLAGHLGTLLRAVNSRVQWHMCDDAPADAVPLVIGKLEKVKRPAIFVGSQGWMAYVSPHAAMPLDSQPNPVGSYAAACFGVSEVWKRLLMPHREVFHAAPIIPLASELKFSTLTYMPGVPCANPDLPEELTFDPFTIAGVGAGGGAAAYTLASLEKVAGAVTLIDPDEVDDTNLNRYVFADDTDVQKHRHKVDVVDALFQPSMSVTVHPYAYNKVAKSLINDDLRYVVACVHSREARREIQLDTPMILWDAGATEDGEFRVWRQIFGVTECMYCKHPRSAEDPEERYSRQLSLLIGLDASRFLTMIRNNDAFTAVEAAAIAARLHGQAITFDLPNPWQRFSDWESKQCGRWELPELDDGVPIPFAPVMAGVLIAGEVIKQKYFPQFVLDSMYWNTLLGSFVLRVKPQRRRPTPGCAHCSDPAYTAQYARKWASTATR